MAMIAHRLACRGAALAASAATMQAKSPSAIVRHDIGRTGGLGLLYRDFDVNFVNISSLCISFARFACKTHAVYHDKLARAKVHLR